ncbi:MAG: OadG family protein [Synergistetes bacterium]|nr:OadG family protein [Synergistota bacterium]
MESINTMGGALGLSIVAMSIVFLILGGLALMMVFIKHLAKAIERVPVSPVKEGRVSSPSKVEEVSKPVSKEEEAPTPTFTDFEKDVAAIAAALAVFLGRKTIRIWRIAGPVRTTWKEASRIESIMGGYEGNE